MNNGWRPKAFLYCMEVICPQTGWQVPLIADPVLSKGKAAIAELSPSPKEKRININVRSEVSGKN